MKNNREYYIFDLSDNIVDIITFESEKEKKEYKKAHPEYTIESASIFDAPIEDFYGFDD